MIRGSISYHWVSTVELLRMVFRWVSMIYEKIAFIFSELGSWFTLSPIILAVF